MNIGLMIYGTLDTISGGYLYDRMIVEHLRKLGNKVEIISLPWRNYFSHLADNFSYALCDDIRRRGLDILLQDELNHPSLLLINRRLQRDAKFSIISIVHHLRGSEAHPALLQKLYRLVEKQYLNTTDGFIFNSNATRAAVHESVRTLRPSIIAYPGCDHIRPSITRDSIVRRCMEAGPLRILFIGNLIRRKGLHTLIDALAYLPHQSWRLTVAGSLSADSRYAQHIRQKITAGRLSDNIELLGTVAADNLIPLWERHHCLAVPSSYEGFGIAYLEAMGFGQPVIASTAGGVPEIIRNKEEGFLVSFGNINELALCIDKLAEDRSLLLDMSLAAHKRYCAHHSWEHTAAQVYDFLCHMVTFKSGLYPGKFPATQ